MHGPRVMSKGRPAVHIGGSARVILTAVVTYSNGIPDRWTGFGLARLAFDVERGARLRCQKMGGRRRLDRA